jgi:hypothetical protein
VLSKLRHVVNWIFYSLFYSYLSLCPCTVLAPRSLNARTQLQATAESEWGGTGGGVDRTLEQLKATRKERDALRPPSYFCSLCCVRTEINLVKILFVCPSLGLSPHCTLKNDEFQGRTHNMYIPIAQISAAVDLVFVHIQVM